MHQSADPNAILLLCILHLEREIAQYGKGNPLT